MSYRTTINNIARYMEHPCHETGLNEGEHLRELEILVLEMKTK